MTANYINPMGFNRVGIFDLKKQITDAWADIKSAAKIEVQNNY